MLRASTLILWLVAATALGWPSAASAQGFSRDCPPVAVGTRERPVRFESGTLAIRRGAVFALRISLTGSDFAPGELHYVRIGTSLFGGGLFEPSMGFANSQTDPALRFVVDELLFAELLDAGAIELVATSGASLSVSLVPSALLRARDCIDRHNVPFLDPSDATSRDPLTLLRLLPDQRPLLRSNRTRPVYPELAIREGREGTTVIGTTIGVGGRVTACRILRSSGSSDLDAAACAAVTTWTYSPGTDADGVPVEFTAAQPITWRLEQFVE